jgi:hypothetical protein
MKRMYTSWYLNSRQTILNYNQIEGLCKKDVYSFTLENLNL